MELPPDQPSQIFAVVVTYNPAPTVVDNVRSIASQASHIFVIDNGSPASFDPTLANLEALPGVQLIRNPRNLGIAAALNQGIRAALQQDAAWVATFDQDSYATPDFFSAMRAAAAAHPHPGQVFLIAPAISLGPETAASKSRAHLPIFSSLPVAMTSGSFIRAQAFSELGFYDESMFIDYVDFDFCLRLAKTGRRLIRANKALLLHHLGARTKHSVCGIALNLTSHSALRRYYITRNRFLVYRRYAAAFPGWSLYDFCWMWIEFAKIVCFEPHKLNKLRHAARGFYHALAGISGPIMPSNHAR